MTHRLIKSSDAGDEYRNLVVYLFALCDKTGVINVQEAGVVYYPT